MRLLIQRVSQAAVTIENHLHSSIKQGLLVFIGIGKSDTADIIPRMATKLIELRIFEDTAGKMNLSLQEIKGEVLLVSQFTLFADCRRGRRPDFIEAADPAVAEQLYSDFAKELSFRGIQVKTGIFAADMQISLINDGPVTIFLDSDLIIKG